MQLAADEQGRLSSPELFRPGATFEATVQSDGSIRLVKLTNTLVPIVKPRLVNGQLRGADIQLSRQLVAAAVRAERENQ